MMKKLLFLYGLMISVVFADQKFYEENLEGIGFCSANFLILSTSQDTLTSKAYKQAELISLQFGKLYYKELYKKEATSRDMSVLRTIYLNRLEQEYKRLKNLSNTTYQKIGQCESFLRTILDNQDTITIALQKSQQNVVTKRRVLEALAFTNNPSLNIPRNKVLEIYKNWIEHRPKKKPVMKLLPSNVRVMK